jgi:hypothetical protein
LSVWTAEQRTIDVCIIYKIQKTVSITVLRRTYQGGKHFFFCSCSWLNDLTLVTAIYTMVRCALRGTYHQNNSSNREIKSSLIPYVSCLDGCCAVTLTAAALLFPANFTSRVPLSPLLSYRYNAQPFVFAILHDLRVQVLRNDRWSVLICSLLLRARW